MKKNESPQSSKKNCRSWKHFVVTSRCASCWVPTTLSARQNLLSAVTQGAWQAPEAMTDTWASTSLASYQLHNQVFNPTISPEPCLVKQEKRWIASNLWQYARRIADIGSWCILISLLLVIMTAYSSRFLNHGKWRTHFLWFPNMWDLPNFLKWRFWKVQEGNRRKKLITTNVTGISL